MKVFFDSIWQSADKMRVVRNPFDESAIGEVPDLGPEIVDRTLDGLQRGTDDFHALGREEGHAIFVRLLEKMVQQRSSLIRLIQLEQGKPCSEALSEVNGAIQSVEALAHNPYLIGPEITPLANEPLVRGNLGFTFRQPHGVACVLTPLVFPLLFPTIHTCFALAAGNAVVLKPARTTPLVALKLTELLLECGVPPTSIACVTGPGKTLGEALCSDPRVNFIACMGRIPTVKSIRRSAVFVPIHLQWGCASSIIVDRTADLDRFISCFRYAAFDNAGQSAFTPSWVAAVDEVHDEVVERLSTMMVSINLGNPLDPATQMGPVSAFINQRRFDRLLESELANGARIVAGGKREGRVIEPTLLTDCVPGESMLCRQEVRGPLVGVSKVSKQTAIEALSHQRYHILSLFTNDEAAVVNQAIRLPFENIHVNTIPTWRDGLICIPGHPPRMGIRTSYDRIYDYSRNRDIVVSNQFQ